jgi:hypothetical protein
VLQGSVAQSTASFTDTTESFSILLLMMASSRVQRWLLRDAFQWRQAAEAQGRAL